ncbi:hypothetical protein BZA70DRAFT_274729 [Myxozyma melibiosi]|uniref:N-acetyltransferase domain-containing protein n=1 Tax=Myxozyma melibiosi TaxID=54550 RepID=A0ABR1F9X3_9ASCO
MNAVRSYILRQQQAGLTAVERGFVAEEEDDGTTGSQTDRSSLYSASMYTAYEGEYDDEETSSLTEKEGYNGSEDPKSRNGPASGTAQSESIQSPSSTSSSGYDQTSTPELLPHKPRPVVTRKITTSASGVYFSKLSIGRLAQTAPPAAQYYDKHDSAAGLVRDILPAAGFFTTISPDDRGHMRAVGTRRTMPSSKTTVFSKIFRVADEHVPQCRELVDQALENDLDPLCRYLRGHLSSKHPSPNTSTYKRMQRYHSTIRNIFLRRAAVKGDILIRASVMTESSSLPTALPQQTNDSEPLLSQATGITMAPSYIKEISPVVGFAQWRVVLEKHSPYSLRLFLFDVQTLPARMNVLLDEFLYLLQAGSLLRSMSFVPEFPGGVVDEFRYSHYLRSKRKIQKRVFQGRKYITVQNLVVSDEYRNEGIASQLLQYGLDMADTQNLPIYMEVSSLPLLILCETFGFKLIHELRLIDPKTSKPAAAATMDVTQPLLSSSKAMGVPQSCSVYCMVREPDLKKLTPLPVLPPSRRKSLDEEVEKY